MTKIKLKEIGRSKFLIKEIATNKIFVCRKGLENIYFFYEKHQSNFDAKPCKKKQLISEFDFISLCF